MLVIRGLGGTVSKIQLSLADAKTIRLGRLLSSGSTDRPTKDLKKHRRDRERITYPKTTSQSFRGLAPGKGAKGCLKLSTRPRGRGA